MTTEISLPFSQSCENNKHAILTVLTRWLTNSESVLEIGSGTAQHATYFATKLPQLVWQSSEQSQFITNTQARIQLAALSNLPETITLDVNKKWPEASYDAIFSANTCHIMSWKSVENFLANGAKQLNNGGLLLIYGPFNYDRDYTSTSNQQFDQMLRSRDPLSGIRDFEAMQTSAQAQGLQLKEDNTMPANNRLLVWQKAR